MNQDVQDSSVTRGPILLLALLGACIWLLLSIVTGGAPAAADDKADESGGLLGNLTATVDGAVPLATVSQTLNEVVEPTVEQLAPVVNVVTTATEPVLDPVLEPVARVVEALEPVLQQPLISDAVNLLNEPDVVSELADVHSVADAGSNFSDPLISAEAPPLAAPTYEPGPAAVKVNAVTPDTRVMSIPAAGSLSSPGLPDAPAPVAPAPMPAPALGQASGAPALVASLEGDGEALTLAVASASSATFNCSSSPTFDNDASPD